MFHTASRDDKMTKPKQKPSRIATLRERVEQAGRDRGAKTFDVPFRGDTIALRRIKIETDFPLYRIQSGRTHRAQSEYLDQHPQLGNDFFDDPEDPKVQKAQHELLLKMISEGELDTDLKERGQRAPLVLTFDGYVVDGNRRLVALREERHQYAEAVVLPEDAQSHEIYETEIELQMQRETKAPYDWIDQAVHIDYGIKVLGERPEVVAKRMRMTKEAITEELQKLELVRMFLTWLGQEGKIHKVPTSGGGQMQQVFEDMGLRFASTSFKRKREPERRMIREMCFAQIRRGAAYKEIRGLIKHLSQNAKRISHRLRERIPSPKRHADATDHARKTTHPSNVSDEDPLRQFAAATATSITDDVQTLIDAAKDEAAAAAVMDIVDEIDAEDREVKRQQLPLQRIEAALGSLKQVTINEDTEELVAVAKALNRVAELVDKLSQQIEKLQSRKKK
jgi:hypothetical protein